MALRVEDLRRLQAFDNRCLRSIAGVGWYQRIRNVTVGKRVFGHVEGTSIDDHIQHNKLGWLVCVLRIPGQRLPKKVLFSMPDSEWRKPRRWSQPDSAKGYEICDEELGISGCEPASWMGSV